MFGPLMFSTGDGPPFHQSSCMLGNDEDLESVPCLLCTKEFLFPDEKEVCLSHLLQEHFMVISDAHLIADIAKYMKFWKEKFDSTGDFKQYCTTLLADTKNKFTGIVEENKEFYLLSEAEAIDKELREKLQKERLEVVLEQQRIEREDSNYSHECLFCRQVLGPTRGEFITHLSSEHNLHLGNPNGLVYVDKLIEDIEDRMDSLQCIYCEKFFKDRNVLKEHMRKKGHKRINPNNEMYDKYFMINYVEPGKTWKEREKSRQNKKKSSLSGSTTGEDDDDSDEDNDDADWSDWEGEIQQPIVCLFCELSLPNWASVLSHMKTQHSFDYEQNSSALNFYEQLKLVNYIRHRVYRHHCITCDAVLPSTNELLKHMVQENHLVMPERNLWNQPEYFFPTYEDDAFLTQIEDKEEEEKGDDQPENVVVV